MLSKFVGAAVVAAAMVAAVPAQAASFVFSGSSATSGTYGLTSSPVTAGGISVTASAWSTATNGAADLPVTAYLGTYGGGLGVTNRTEGSGGNNTHTLDNVLAYDFIRLEFSTAVKLTGLILNGFDVGGPAPAADTDAWVSYGNTSDTFNAAGWTGYLSRGTSVASGAAGSFTGSTFAKVWLIAADRSGNDRNDGFKVGVVNAVVPQVPEPATWLTMILGFGLMGSLIRRRATSVAHAVA